tara:strand:+ start:5711 stop:6400 length:690 start_codon:yes stop_codon:yes gene_type:complete
MDRTLKKIEPAISLTEETADRLRDAIIWGELPLGCKLSEQRLADMLGVSRSPVRDALAALQSEGLVKVSPKRGSFVFTPDLKVVDDLCEHRCILETASLRKAISSSRDLLLQGLGLAVAAMEKAVADLDRPGFTKGDIEFHNTIITCGGNRSIAVTYRRTISPLMALRTHLFVSMNDALDRSMDEHLELIEACRRGQVDEAAALVEDHIYHLSEAYRAALAKETLQKAV